ncbi:MAG TPA: expansin EXLX1 family cellulose-binding protein [Minicystis sp.]|nr:expansin EXLX1 family cellulose-binding protein [Minicystis sp.]
MSPRRASLALAASFAFVAACGGSGGGSSNGTGGAGGMGGASSGPSGPAGPGSGAGSSAGGAPGTTSTGTGNVDPSCTSDTTQHGGDATYYDADGSGNCSFDPSPNDLMVGAMNHVDYAASAVCGGCVHMKGPSGEATIRIVDQCPECNQGDIDLSMLAFSKLADPSLGRVHIDWTYVACDVTGPIVYHFKEGSNPYWTAVQIRNARYMIDKFEVMKNGAFQAVDRVDYNFFVDASGMGPGPYTFRVTDVKGHVLTDSNVPFVDAGDAPGAAQFPVCQGD